MSKKFDYDHHQPRQIDKKKRHRAGFSEDALDSRRNRINFKNYVRQLEEEQLSDYGDDEDDYEDL